MPTAPMKPFLVAKNAQGEVRLTLRETRHNSQGYPWVMTTLVEQTFATTAAARAYAAEQYGAKPGEFASK